MTFLDHTLPALIGLLVWGVPTGWVARQLWLARASRRWPSTNGRVLRASVNEDPYLVQGRGAHDVCYQYVVDGKTYVGYRVRFGGWLNANWTRARRDVSRYREGSVVSVRYDPRRPHVSTLERTVSRLVWMLLGIGAFFIVAIGGALAGLWS